MDSVCKVPSCVHKFSDFVDRWYIIELGMPIPTWEQTAPVGVKVKPVRELVVMEFMEAVPVVVLMKQPAPLRKPSLRDPPRKT